MRQVARSDLKEVRGKETGHRDDRTGQPERTPDRAWAGSVEADPPQDQVRML